MGIFSKRYSSYLKPLDRQCKYLYNLGVIKKEIYMTVRVSEIFLSVQGELDRTCVQTVFIRLFGCNLKCDGFGQKNPTDPSTYILPYKTIDFSKYKSILELPVFPYGCDSSYSWDPAYKKLAKDYTIDELENEIRNLLPSGSLRHPKTKNEYDLCFTGGEPMMQQKAIAEVINRFRHEAHQLESMRFQIETNGTKKLKELATFDYLHFNTSPKLFTVSGEPSDKAWFPEIISEYYEQGRNGALKFVVNGTPECWDELDTKVEEYRKYDNRTPIMVMPVGATKEDQENVNHVGSIATEAIKRGYHVSGRLHTIFWGNTPGT
jgi:organic radical activating enzyme